MIELLPSADFEPLRREIREHARKPGVSVIIATADRPELLKVALRSIAAQNVDPSLVEVIVVANGKDDSDESIFRDFRESCPDSLQASYIRNLEAGASRARNVGLRAATRRYVTFLDDDDYLEPDCLSEMLNVGTNDSIVITEMIDLKSDGTREASSPINLRIKGLPREGVQVSEVPWVLGFNAAKLIPWQLVEGLSFKEDLNSGEDVAFFAEFLKLNHLEVVPVRTKKEAAYVRVLTKSSISRREQSFQFNVAERLAVIRRLQQLEDEGAQPRAIDSIRQAQIGFILRYLDRLHLPNEIDAVLDAVSAAAVRNFPWDSVPRPEPQCLVFSYCFPPFNDPSGNVVAKRILENRSMVDVVSNDMSKIRNRDSSLFYTVRRWIEDHFLLDEPVSFSDWESISSWGVEASRCANGKSKDYKEMYSRALWPQSHVAAALYKIDHPDIFWTAEFSDPLALGVDGLPRSGPLSENNVTTVFEKLTGRAEGKTLFELVEEVTLMLADAVVFTNSNQREMMLERYNPTFKSQVIAKSTIKSQPIPPREMYELGNNAAKTSPVRLNIGFFGSFYENRGVQGVLRAVEGLDAEMQSKLSFHLFTNSEVDLNQFDLGRTELRTYQPVSYADFLATTNAMDILLVQDTEELGAFTKNPFLPSKLSDYRGASARIWGICAKNSPLSSEDVDYRSSINCQREMVDALSEMIDDHSLG